jgi:hypothetical protein
MPMLAIPLQQSLARLLRITTAQPLLLAQMAITPAANKPQAKAGRRHRINSNSSASRGSVNG